MATVADLRGKGGPVRHEVHGLDPPFDPKNSFACGKALVAELGLAQGLFTLDMRLPI